jgi:hypothetical protein
MSIRWFIQISILHLSDDDSSDYDNVNYFQDDPNPFIHTSEYESAPEGNYHDNMNNNNHDDLDGEHNTDSPDSLF